MASILSSFISFHSIGVTTIKPDPKPEPSNKCCKVGKIICTESCNSGAASVHKDLYGEYVLGHIPSEEPYYLSKNGKFALAWDNIRRVWNLGSADHPGTAWVWSNDDVTCPNEIEQWSYWDENGQVQDALKTLEFHCPKGSGEFILSTG